MMALYLCLVLSALPGTIAVTALCQRKRTATSCSPGCVRAQLFSCIQFSETPWTASRQAPLSMGFSRQEYWSGLLFTSPGNLPNPGVEPRSPSLQLDSLRTKPPGKLSLLNFLLHSFLPRHNYCSESNTNYYI